VRKLTINHGRLAWQWCWLFGVDQMHFDERNIGDYRIFVGAVEAPKGQGYVAAMVIEQAREKGSKGHREVLRDDNIACGHRWACPSDALNYAIKKAQEAIRERTPALAF
jgi:hypothetical protein